MIILSCNNNNKIYCYLTITLFCGIVNNKFESEVKKLTGAEVKAFILEQGVRLWQVAQKLNMNDGNFSRKLRNNFTEEEVKQVETIVQELKAKN